MQFDPLYVFVSLYLIKLIVALSPCPRGWTFVKPYCWKYNPNPVSWSEARLQCRKLEAELASIHSEIENKMLFSFIDKLYLNRKSVRVKRKSKLPSATSLESCFEKHTGSILVGYAEVVFDAADANACLMECQDAQTLYSIKCNSVQYYQLTKDCILNVESRFTKPDLFTTDTTGLLVDYYDNKCLDRAPSTNDSCFQLFPKMVLVGFAEQVFTGLDTAQCRKKCVEAKSLYDFYCRSFIFFKTDSTCVINKESKKTRPDLFISDPDSDYYEREACQTVPPPSGCKNNAMDLFFIVDSSSSIGQQGFENIRQFLKNVVNAVTVGPDNTQVGLLQFNDQPKTEFHLKSYQTASEVLAAIDEIQWMGGHTFIGKALQYATDNELIVSHGDRTPNVPDVVLVLTDGLSQDNPMKLVQLMRSNGVILYAIGISEAVLDEQLVYIAGGMERVYKVKDFSQLNVGLRDQILRDVCNPPKPSTLCSSSSYSSCALNIDGYGPKPTGRNNGLYSNQPSTFEKNVDVTNQSIGISSIELPSKAVQSNNLYKPSLIINQIHKPSENLKTEKIFRPNPRPRGVWLGITDQFKEGNFGWVDKTEVNYTNWKVGQPNGGVRENCVVSLDEPLQRWIDTPCSSRNPFVCKMFPNTR